MALVALVERDDQSHAPALGGQAEIAHGIMGAIQGSGLDRQAEGFFGSIERGETKRTIMAIPVGHRDDQGQLATMAQGIGGQFIASVAVDPAMAVAVPAPKGVWVAIGSMAAAAFIRFLAPIVAAAELLAMGIGPGGQLGPIPRNMEMVQVNQADLNRVCDKAAIEEPLQHPLPARQ